MGNWRKASEQEGCREEGGGGEEARESTRHTRLSNKRKKRYLRTNAQYVTGAFVLSATVPFLAVGLRERGREGAREGRGRGTEREKERASTHEGVREEKPRSARTRLRGETGFRRGSKRGVKRAIRDTLLAFTCSREAVCKLHSECSPG